MDIEDCDDNGSIETEAVEVTQDAFVDVLGVVGISRVVVVDDDLEPDVTDVIAALESMEERDVVLPHIGQLDLGSERELWEGDLRDSWEGLKPIDRESVAKEVNGTASLDESFEKLGLALGSSIELRFLTPSAWELELEDVVDSSDSMPTLVLFDRDMGGDAEAGTRLAQALLQGENSDSIWAGLLTNTATRENEGSLRDRLVSDLADAGDRFVVMSKGHLDDEAASFVEALRLALVQRPASGLLRAVSQTIQDHANAAARKLENLSPAQFERIVFGLSEEEGTWEIDMLLRLFDVYLRSDVRAELHQDGSVRDSTRTLRDLHNLRGEREIPLSVQARSIYRRELYDDGSHLASVGAPIELGDIFEKEDGNRRFVVVCQPCDLMVRSDGRRAPEMAYILVLPLTDEKRNDPRRSFELPSFDNHQSWWAQLDRPAMVPAEALDFCVFDSGGRAVAPSSDQTDDSSWRLPSWEKRRLQLLVDCDGLRALGNISHDALRAKIRAAYGVRADCIVKPVIEPGGENFGFGIQRTRRILAPFGRALLSAYSAFQARDDFDMALV